MLVKLCTFKIYLHVFFISFLLTFPRILKYCNCRLALKFHCILCISISCFNPFGCSRSDIFLLWNILNLVTYYFCHDLLKLECELWAGLKKMGIWPSGNFFWKKWQFLAIFFEKNVKFLAIFWQSNGNFPEGQVQYNISNSGYIPCWQCDCGMANRNIWNRIVQNKSTRNKIYDILQTTS